MQSFCRLFCCLIAIFVTIEVCGAAVTPITEANVPLSVPGNPFDVNTNPANIYGLGPGTTLNPNGFDVRDLFGGAYTPLAQELHNVIFSDQSTGYPNKVLISLANPVQLTGYELYLAEDPTSGSRNSSGFRLYAGATLLDSVTLLDSSGTQKFVTVHGSRNIKVSNTLSGAPLSSSYTLEFIQNQNVEFGGVRAQEFVGFVPEPASLGIVGMVIAAFCGRPGRSRRVIGR